MGLILCEKLHIKHPLYVDALAIRLHSLEELCYVIYEYPMLVLEDFVDDRLLDFLDNELKMGLTAVQIRKHVAEGYSDIDVLLAILEYSDYYSSVDIDRYKNKIISIKKLSRTEYLKEKADFLYSFARYGKAIKIYEKAIEESAVNPKDVAIQAGILNNMGCCLVNTLAYEKAFDSFIKSYTLHQDSNVLKNIYFLSLTDPVIEHKERYQAAIGSEIPRSWETEYQSIINHSKNADKIEKINEYFTKDSVKKNRQITTQLNTWKKEYRNMI